MFDPFEKRVSRDIRNRLSKSFLDNLAAPDKALLEKCVPALKAKAPDQAHQEFIDERVRRCKIVLDQVRGQPAGPFEIAGLLWENNLFFECHEWLEDVWRPARGDDKRAIQALIRTAGAFALFEAGRKDPARSSALKATGLIREYADHIPAPFRPNGLITALEKISQDR